VTIAASLGADATIFWDALVANIIQVKGGDMIKIFR
jgi:hypothetical protein